VPGLFSHGCGFGACCAETRELATADFPKDVRFVSVYSKSDGIVDWRSCLDPAAEHVEIVASHIGMAVNPQAFRAVAGTLAPRAKARKRRAPHPRREAA
jgi:hypothetical protein